MRLLSSTSSRSRSEDISRPTGVLIRTSKFAVIDLHVEESVRHYKLVLKLVATHIDDYTLH